MTEMPPVHPPGQPGPPERSSVPWALFALALTATAVGSGLIPFLSITFRDILEKSDEALPRTTILALSNTIWPVMPVLVILSIAFVGLPIRRRIKIRALLVILLLALALGVAFLAAIIYPLFRDFPMGML